MPSMISFTDNQIKIGDKAKDDKDIIPLNTIHSIKRIIGKPFDDPEHQNYYLLEAAVKPQALKGWQAKLGLGLDRGKVTGDNLGAQLTVSHTFSFKN